MSDPPTRLRVNVDRVLIPVSVLDWHDRPVLGLTKDNFRLYENGTAQDILEMFSEDSPIGIGIVVDASGSMQAVLEQIREAVNVMVRTSVPSDEFFLIVFSDDVHLLCSPTTAIRDIQQQVETIEAEGPTALFDAIYLALNYSRHTRQPRRVLLVFSDGGENSSRFTKRELMAAVREADTRIFSISARKRSRTLEYIAEQSGGRAVGFLTNEQLYRLSHALSAEMHTQYILGYSPRDRRADGQYRKVTVDYIPPEGTPELRVYWRRGYFAPDR